jgi:uncharacterized protein (DUF58 family)
VRLTLRGWLVLGAVPVLYVAGELSGFALARALAGLAAGALLAALLVTGRRLQVSVSREVYPDRVESGQPAMALLRVHNPGSRRHPGFIAKDVFAGREHDIAVQDLAVRGSATYRYPLSTERRGRYEVGPLSLERHDPLGLVRSQVVAGDVAPLWVHPRRYPVRTVKIGWPRHHYDGPGSRDPLAGSTQLRQIREYVPGDEIRHVHWKAAAHTGTLMVREYTDPAEPRFTIVLDDRADVLDTDQFEQAVEVVASLGYAAVQAGHHTRLVSISGRLDGQPQRGDVGARELLDQLADIEQQAGSGGVPAGSGGAIVLVSGGRGVDAGLLASLGGGAGTAAITVVDLAPSSATRPSGVRVIAAASAAEAIQTWNRAATG